MHYCKKNPKPLQHALLLCKPCWRAAADGTFHPPTHPPACCCCCWLLEGEDNAALEPHTQRPSCQMLWPTTLRKDARGPSPLPPAPPHPHRPPNPRPAPSAPLPGRRPLPPPPTTTTSPLPPRASLPPLRPVPCALCGQVLLPAAEAVLPAGRRLPARDPAGGAGGVGGAAGPQAGACARVSHAVPPASCVCFVPFAWVCVCGGREGRGWERVWRRARVMRRPPFSPCSAPSPPASH